MSLDLIGEARARVEPALAEALERAATARPEDGPPGSHAVPDALREAMAYALLSPGKRLRPALALGGAYAVGADLDDALPAACAVEMIHAYSLIHDDLPMLDDDDERRGQPATHRRFGEATALLAGDALLTEALGLIADGRPFGEGRNVPDAARAAATVELARAAGAGGMVGGQQDDLTLDAGQRAGATREAVVSIHRRKTGRLIQASVVLGGLFGGATFLQLDILRRFGAAVGLAFQLVDDALDGDGVAHLDGTVAARGAGTQQTDQALAAVSELGHLGEPLAALARRMVERTK